MVYFLYGTLIGSFLNVCIYRLPLHQSLLMPGSYCPNCNHKINIPDIIPIISYLLLCGKCSYCKSAISPVYPLVEFINGLLFVFVYFCFGTGYQSIVICLFFSILIVVFFIDLKHYIIPNSLNLSIAILAIISIPFNNHSFMTMIIGALIISLPVYILALITKGFGGGDVKLFASAGLFTGPRLIFIATFIAVVLGGIFCSILVIAKKKSLKSQIPFGPFIVIGLISSVLLGDALIEYYMKAFMWFVIYP